MLLFHLFGGCKKNKLKSTYPNKAIQSCTETHPIAVVDGFNRPAFDESILHEFKGPQFFLQNWGTKPNQKEVRHPCSA